MFDTDAAVTPGSAAEKAERRKRRSFEEFGEGSAYDLVPLAIESYGRLGLAASRFLSELGREGNYKIKPNRYVRTWKVMGEMPKDQIDHVRHVGLHALHEKDTSYPWQSFFSQVSGEVPLSELLEIKMYSWFPKIAQFSLKMDAPGKVKLGLSSTKAITIVVGGEALHETTPEITLDLPAGITPISAVISRDAKDISSFRVEILDGAVQVVGQ